MGKIDQFDFNVLMVRLENAEQNIINLKKNLLLTSTSLYKTRNSLVTSLSIITDLQKDRDISKDAINSLIQLETKLSKKVTDLKNYQDNIIQWGGFY